jgi:transketolase
MSAADIVAVLFFAEMRFDPRNPRNPDSDRFVLSKGHGAPLLYAAWAEAGAFDRAELLKLRRIDSDLEGHPTPRLPFVDVATGSLGQGLGAGLGMALDARRTGSGHRTYVLMGDGESMEGSVWEAAMAAILPPTPVRHHRERARPSRAMPGPRSGATAGAGGLRMGNAIDGHDFAALLTVRSGPGAGGPRFRPHHQRKGVARSKGGRWHGVPFKPIWPHAPAEPEAQRWRPGRPHARQTAGPEGPRGGSADAGHGPRADLQVGGSGRHP